MTAAGIPAKVRKQVLTRADGFCERCGVYARLELHHRLFRSRGGAHTAANLVALCGFGSTAGCHGFAHSEGFAAVATGWAVRSGRSVDPSRVPFKDSRGFWWLLADDGTKSCIPVLLAAEYRALYGMTGAAIKDGNHDEKENN